MISLNIQPIEKQELSDGKNIDIVNIWKTIQGEGPFVGTPSIFIRMAGCNLQCSACDTDYTTSRYVFSIEQVLEKVDKEANENTELIVLTGGEPFRQNIGPLVRLLLNSYNIQIETNGTLFLDDFPYTSCTVVCSPKTGSVNQRLIPYIHSYKYIIEDGQVDDKDGLPLSSLWSGVRVARPVERCFKSRIYVQPLDVGDEAENKKHTKAALDSCMKFGYRMCLQTHKMLGLP